MCVIDRKIGWPSWPGSRVCPCQGLMNHSRSISGRLDYSIVPTVERTRHGTLCLCVCSSMNHHSSWPLTCSSRALFVRREHAREDERAHLSPGHSRAENPNREILLRVIDSINVIEHPLTCLLARRTNYPQSFRDQSFHASPSSLCPLRPRLWPLLQRD